MTKNETLKYWVEEYTDSMFSWAVYKISDEEVAKDILQDTFFAISKNYEKFNGSSKAKTWIFSILNNKISDYYRIKYRNSEKISFENVSNFFDEHGSWKDENRPSNWSDSENELVDDEEFIAVLNYCLENLPPKYNTIVQMKYFLTQKSETICKDLDISTTNFWQLMHRAKLKLRDCIENNWFEKN